MQAIVLALIEHLGWPLVVVWVSVWFREPLTTFLTRVKSLKAPGVELTTNDAGEQQSSPKLLSNDELALRGTADSADRLELQASAQAALPFVENLDEKRIAVKTFGGNNDALERQITFIKYQLVLLRFPSASEETSSALVRHLAVYQLLYNCENTYRRIFGSQVDLLQSLNTDGPQSAESLKVLYRDVRIRYKKFYADYKFEDWIGFLHTQGAVALEGDDYVISHFGHEFVKWLVDNRLPNPPH